MNAATALPDKYGHSDGAAIRRALIRAKLLVPAEMVARRPRPPFWHDEPPTLPLLESDRREARRLREAQR